MGKRKNDDEASEVRRVFRVIIVNLLTRGYVVLKRNFNVSNIIVE